MSTYCFEPFSLNPSMYFNAKDMEETNTRTRCSFCVHILNLVSKIVVLVVLLFYTSLNIAEGPLKSFLRNSTIIRKNEINVSGK